MLFKTETIVDDSSSSHSEQDFHFDTLGVSIHDRLEVDLSILESIEEINLSRFRTGLWDSLDRQIHECEAGIHLVNSIQQHQRATSCSLSCSATVTMAAQHFVGQFASGGPLAGAEGIALTPPGSPNKKGRQSGERSDFDMHRVPGGASDFGGGLGLGGFAGPGLSSVQNAAPGVLPVSGAAAAPGVSTSCAVLVTVPDGAGVLGDDLGEAAGANLGSTQLS